MNEERTTLRSHGHRALAFLIRSAVSLASVMRRKNSQDRRHDTDRLRALIVVVVAMLASLGILAWIRLQQPAPRFGTCARLREAGMPILPQDWFCHPEAWHRDIVIGSTLVSLGLMLPGVILALMGRRFTAVLPLLLGSLAGGRFEDWWADASTPRGPLLTAVAVGLLLAAPAVAGSWIGRHPPLPRIRLVPAVAASLALGVTAWIVLALSQRAGYQIAGLKLTASAVVVGTFAALLGTDRRRWPWALVPVAVLLSPAPIGLFVVESEFRGGWGLHVVLPLVLVGLVCSAWHPLADRLTDLRANAARARAGRDVFLRSTRARANALNVIAAAMLIASLSLSETGVALEREVPTFLKKRETVENWRTRADLYAAMRAMDGYFAENGTYEGFDPEEGLAAVPSLVWLDGQGELARSSTTREHPPVAIVESSSGEARIAALSWTDRAFCIEHVRGGGMTYGTAEKLDPYGMTRTRDALRSAIAACDSVPWTDETIQPPAPLSCTDREVGYVMCRTVEAFLQEVMEREPSV